MTLNDGLGIYKWLDAFLFGMYVSLMCLSGVTFYGFLVSLFLTAPTVFLLSQTLGKE